MADRRGIAGNKMASKINFFRVEYPCLTLQHILLYSEYIRILVTLLYMCVYNYTYQLYTCMCMLINKQECMRQHISNMV